MTVRGYVRVSTEEQNEARQLTLMEREGVEELYVDKASGKDFDRAGYERLMADVEPGDLLVLDALDRLGRDYDGLVAEWKRLSREAGCDVAALDVEFMDTRKFRAMGDMGKVVEDMALSMLAWAAERERKEMLRKQRDGIEEARKAGKYKGRKRVEVDPALLERAAGMQRAREITAQEAAGMLGVSRATFYNLAKLVAAGG